jgi:hypothetical protein
MDTIPPDQKASFNLNKIHPGLCLKKMKTIKWWINKLPSFKFQLEELKWCHPKDNLKHLKVYIHQIPTLWWNQATKLESNPLTKMFLSKLTLLLKLRKEYIQLTRIFLRMFSLKEMKQLILVLPVTVRNQLLNISCRQMLGTFSYVCKSLPLIFLMTTLKNQEFWTKVKWINQ